MTKKVLYLNSAFTKEVPKEGDNIDSIMISGYANTVTKDRAGDVIPTEAWYSALENYLKNPILLAYHDYSKPVGKTTEHSIDEKGLWIKGRISAAAGEVFNLVKDGILTAFSVGFIVKDATYDAQTDLFIIKELELLEISVVPVPANQDSIFSLSKDASDSDPADYAEFKKQFAIDSKEDKGLSNDEKANAKPPQSEANKQKEIDMDPLELEKLLAKAASNAADAVNKANEERIAKEKAEAKAAAELAEKEASEKAKIEAAAKEAVKIQLGESGAEKLLADVTKRFEEESKETKDVLEGLRAELKDKADEIKALQTGKMVFSEKGGKKADYAQIEKAVLLSEMTGKSIEDTKFGADLIEKVGSHVPSATWELEVSMNMEEEVRRRLVVAPLIRSIDMQTNVMTIPVNPEAGHATWVTNAQFGTTASPGAAQTHQLSEITLNAYKVATMEYLPFEEEEDSLLAILPVVRDAMIRRVARAVDKAYLYGAGSGADPVKGLALYDATSVVVPTVTGAASVANLRSLRKDLGAWGLDPADVAYVVSTDIYYDLLDDTLFQTVDKVGDKASLLTGQVGSIGNSPVLVSAELPSKAGGAATASTNIGAIALASGNFLAGNQRGLRFDTDDLVETQRKVLVSSLRTGLTQVTTNLGQGVSTLRWS